MGSRIACSDNMTFPKHLLIITLWSVFLDMPSNMGQWNGKDGENSGRYDFKAYAMVVIVKTASYIFVQQSFFQLWSFLLFGVLDIQIIF